MTTPETTIQHGKFTIVCPVNHLDSCPQNLVFCSVHDDEGNWDILTASSYVSREAAIAKIKAQLTEWE